MSSSQKRVALAFLFGIVLIIGAFMLGENQKTQTGAALAIVPIATREHIAVADEDQNNVPDWQDSLFTEDEVITLSTTTASYTPPTTVTGKFGVSFFERIMNAKLFGAFGDSNEEIVQKSTDTLMKEAQDELFILADLTQSEKTDTASLKAYGNQVASILTAHPKTGRDEMTILSEALKRSDDNVLQELIPITAAYGEMVTDLSAVAVPKTYTQEHLDVLNSVNAVYEDIRAMQNLEEDPLYTLLRTKRYEDDVQGLANAISILFNTLYLNDNVRWNEGESATRLVQPAQ